MSSLTVLDLPLELLHHVLSFLPLSSIHVLGATCRDLHRIIHLDDHLWKFRVRKKLKLGLVTGDLIENLVHEGEDDELEGTIRDTSLQGYKELFVIYSPEFKNVLKHWRSQQRMESDLERILKAFLPRFLKPTPGIVDFKWFPRVALFGPGIESPNTKHLVHKIVNSHTSVFDALSFISGLPGGFGSGVRIDFCKTYTFDLMCLYTNSAKVRESRTGNAARLLASNNRLLVNDIQLAEEVDDNDPSQDVLHDSVLKLLPTLNALMFSIDGTELHLASGHPEEKAKQFMFLKSELKILISALDKREKHIPVLVLSCYWRSKDKTMPVMNVDEIASELGLTNSVTGRPWGVFNVDIETMDGMVKALSWLLYHVQKRRNNLEYHQIQSEKQQFL